MLEVVGTGRLSIRYFAKADKNDRNLGRLAFGRSSKLFCRWISSYKTFFSACSSSASRWPICTACALDSSCFFSHSVSSAFSAFSCCPIFVLHCKAIALRANSVAEMLCNLACSWIFSLSSWSIRIVKFRFCTVFALLLLCNLTGEACIMVSLN